jgi:hypothetical protein
MAFGWMSVTVGGSGGVLGEVPECGKTASLDLITKLGLSHGNRPIHTLGDREEENSREYN